MLQASQDTRNNGDENQAVSIRQHALYMSKAGGKAVCIFAYNATVSNIQHRSQSVVATNAMPFFINVRSMLKMNVQHNEIMRHVAESCLKLCDPTVS